MCPSQLIQGEDVIIYQSPGLGRLFCQREKREGARERKRVKRRKCLKSAAGCTVDLGVTKKDQAEILWDYFKTLCSSDCFRHLTLVTPSVRKRFSPLISYEVSPVSCQNMSSWKKLLTPGFHYFETLLRPSLLLLALYLPSFLLHQGKTYGACSLAIP